MTGSAASPPHENQTSDGTDRRYDPESIVVLKGLEFVRRRPEMYVGDTDDGSGLHYMVDMVVVDNAVEEAVAGYATRIEVILNADHSVTVRDDGRGIPVEETVEFEGVSRAELLMTSLHSGGGGGGGIAVVNALSSRLRLTVWRDGREHGLEFVDGETVVPLSVVGDARGRRGTELTFLASREIFSNVEYDFETLEGRLRELAFLNSNVTIVLSDRRHAAENRVEMHYPGGVAEFVRRLDRDHREIVPAPIVVHSELNGIRVEAALRWNDSCHENVLCFINNRLDHGIGDLFAGFHTALTHQINRYAKVNGFNSDSRSDASKADVVSERMRLTGEDCRAGLTAVLSVVMKWNSFWGYGKVSPSLRKVFNASLASWFKEHPIEAGIIVGKVMRVAALRKGAAGERL